MKRGLAGLVLGLFELASSAYAAFKLPERFNPEVKEPYEHLVEMFNAAKMARPDMKGVFIRTQDRKKALKAETLGDTVICFILTNPPYVYHSVGLCGQVNDVWKGQDFYVVNKIGQDYELPIHPMLIHERLKQELYLLANPNDMSDVDRIAAMIKRDLNFQQQFELLMHSLYVEKDLDVKPVLRDGASEATSSSTYQKSSHQ